MEWTDEERQTYRELPSEHRTWMREAMELMWRECPCKDPLKTACWSVELQYRYVGPPAK
jgi:hypothetical protein